MKYQLLKPEDIIQEGDEFLAPAPDPREWKKVPPHLWGKTKTLAVPMRRPIPNSIQFITDKD